MHRLIKFIIAISFIGAGLSFIGAGLVCCLGNRSLNVLNHNSLNKTPISKTSKQQLTTKLQKRQGINLLLLGIDDGALKRGTSNGRSDTIMLLSINPKTKKALLTSIPRDMAVNLPNSAGLAKVNTAYPLGGTALLAHTLQTYFKIPIDGYASVNMGGLVAILKEIGGVYVKSPLTFTYDWHSFKKGHTYYLHTTRKTLAYVRARHEDPLGDYGRQIRQRQVLKAMMTKAFTPTVLLNPTKVKIISKNVYSSLTEQQLLYLIMYLPALKHLQQTHAQGSPLMSYNSAYGNMEVEQIAPHEKHRLTNKINAVLN